MEKQLKDIQWKEFILNDIFKIQSTSSGIDRNKLVNKKGNIPYITRTEKDNGYDSFICKQNDSYKVDKSNVITIGLDTQTVFYQPYEFYTGQNLQILDNPNLNKYVASFFIRLFNIQLKKFSWGGNGATLTRLKRSKILLPTTPKGLPDYAFMEEYMREKEQEKINAFQKQIAKRIVEVKNYREVIPLSEKEWKAFKIGDLFIKLEQGKSKGLNHLRKTNLGVNYLGATNLNNGVLCQVEKQNNLIQKGNSIAFIRNGEGSMGYAVYKLEDFIATSDISVGYSPELNRYVGLFITTVADRVRGKYNFGYKRSGERLRKESILLPINTNGQPDYEYMEHYIKKIEYQKLMAFLEMKNILL
jgi:hypothetical protein